MEPPAPPPTPVHSSEDIALAREVVRQHGGNELCATWGVEAGRADERQKWEMAELNIWRGWRDEADRLRAGIDGLLSELGLSTQPGHNPARLQSLETSIRTMRDGLRACRDARGKVESHNAALKGELDAVQKVAKDWEAKADREEDRRVSIELTLRNAREDYTRTIQSLRRPSGLTGPG